MKVIITLSDIISLVVFALFIIGIILYILFSIISYKYKEKSKKWHDCAKCKHHHLRNTPDWYSCDKELYDGNHSHNDVIWTKCEFWEVEDE